MDDVATETWQPGGALASWVVPFIWLPPLLGSTGRKPHPAVSVISVEGANETSGNEAGGLD